MKLRLTDRSVRALQPPTTGHLISFDGEVSGFGCRVTTAGAKAFVLNYRIGRRQRRLTIGAFPDWSTVAARDEAKRLKREVDLGRDPMAERQAERAAPTVADLAERYEAEHLPGKRPRSADEDRALIRDYILPALGRLKVAELATADVAKLHRQITADGKPVRANRMLACLRTMLALAVSWGMRADNPARGGRGGIGMNAEDHRERFLSAGRGRPVERGARPAPRAHHGGADKVPTSDRCPFGEVAHMTWDQVDLERGSGRSRLACEKQKAAHRTPQRTGAGAAGLARARP